MNEHLKTKDSIEEVIKGANILGDIVLQTLGPKGKNILIEKSTGPELSMMVLLLENMFS